MNRLKDTTILVGKDPVTGRLLISMKVDGKLKAAPMGESGSVPDCVSRCKPAEGVGHCKIDIDAEGTMKITNLKERNITYVNGTEVISRKITPDSKIELGCDRYPVYISSIINTAKKMIPEPKPEWNIYPLKAIYEKYHDDLIALQKEQKRQALVKGLYMPLSVLSGLAGVAMKALLGDEQESTAQMVSYVFYGLAAVVLFYGLYKSFSDKSIEKKEEITNRFYQDYVCSNPECNHFMGNQPYTVLRRTKVCPYCHCKLVEKETEE